MSIFTANLRKQRFHTPTTFKAQRRLTFTPASSSVFTSGSSNPPLPVPPPLPNSPHQHPRIDPTDGKPYTLPEFIMEYGGSLDKPPIEWNNATAHVAQLSPTIHELTLPWDEPGGKTSNLFKHQPPSLSYPAGSRDEDTNRRFLKRMDHYLFSSIQVRAAIVGKRPHPFSEYQPLEVYWLARGKTNWVFNTSKTFDMLA